MNDRRVGELLEQLPKSFEKWSAELATGLRSFEGAVALRGARYVPVSVTGSTLAQNGQGRLVGWSLRATGGSVTVIVRDAADPDNGATIAAIELAAETSETIWLGDGVSFVNGLYVITARPPAGVGQVQGSLFVGAVG